MLQLINYDLHTPTKSYPALRDGVALAGGGIHVLNGPWICGAAMSPQQVLDAVTGELIKTGDSLEGDKLLVFPVLMGEISTGRNPKYQPIEPHKGTKVFAVAYTLRNPSGDFHVSKAEQEKHRVAVTKALQKLGETCHPLESLWLVKTDQSTHDVYGELEQAVPLSPKDELVVAEVDREAILNGYPIKGDEAGLDPADHKWLVEAGVL